ALEGADMIFITAGMGGGTGTGSASVVARISQELGALTVAVVTKPFSFEGPRRMQQALEGIRKLQQHVDALIIVSNDRLLTAVDHKTSVKEAFFIADQVLHHGVKGISDIINVAGLINVDFADVRSILTGAGQVIMGIGAGRGENLVQEASERAVNSALLETTIEGATKLLVNVVGGEALTLHDAQEIVKRIREATGRDDANVLFGVTYQENIGDEVRVIMVATGFNEARTIVSPVQTLAVPAAQGLRARMGKRLDFNPDDTEIPAFLRYNPDAD
ncbi:MAG: cell division protein FtsZ, partial [Deinococcus sp.]|nr:cell division protein FtsZ [Deinococcus sp.]